jgi:FKBP-type peptidyl-prolyl cis-trans isomerase
MQRLFLCLMALAAGLNLRAQQIPEEVREKLSYQEGFALGRQLLQQVEQEGGRGAFLEGFNAALARGVDQTRVLYTQGAQVAAQSIEQGADTDRMLRGLEDALAGKERAYSEEEIRTAMERYQEIRRELQANLQRAQAERENAGEAFLRENAARDKVVTTLTGLQYEVLEAGEGPKPTLQDVVSIHFTSRTLDGTVLNSTVERGEAAQLRLANQGRGWTEILQLMSTGATYRFWVPAQHIFGDRRPPQMPANEILDIEVELIRINP